MREGVAYKIDRRRPVLRAQGNQGRARLHAPRHQPARRRQPAPGDQRAGARHRQGRDGRDREDRRRRRRSTTTLPLLSIGLQPALSANSLWSKLVRGLDDRAFTGRAAASLAVFRDLIVKLTEVARQEPVSIAIGKMLDQSGYLQDLRDERSEEAEGRVENLAELVSAAREYESREPEPSLNGVRRSAVAAVRRRRGAGHARRARLDDDAAQRQGARVPGRHPGGARRRTVPALAVGAKTTRSSKRSGGSATSA